MHIGIVSVCGCGALGFSLEFWGFSLVLHAIS